METIESGAFINMTKLRQLHLVRAKLKRIQPRSFDGLLSLKQLSTDDYRLCCLFTNITCSVINPTPLDSCSRLTNNDVLSVAVWFIGFGALVGNLLVIFIRSREDRYHGNSVQRLFITNLAFADFLMGVYMVTIASADIYYGDRYYLSAPLWKESSLCRWAGFVALLSSESTVFLLALITLDRFICITFPFGTVRFRPKSAQICVAVVWMVTFSLSFAPTLTGLTGSSIYGLSDVCIGLPFNTYTERNGYITFHSEREVYEFFVDGESKQRPYWLYSIALFLGVNFILLILIFFCYLVIFLQVRRSAKITGSERMKREMRMTAKMALIVGTDLCCWMPVIIMGILSQTGVIDLPVSLYAWAVVFILPINSTVNPYLYSFVALCSHKKDRFPLSRVGVNDPHMTDLAKTHKMKHDE
ncbi:G-protein coupled receptor GRL101-like [Lytechinus variegatus]|uniref:G-protein coupled receptor GRL101-like n=1 Tax=Lytechinus variegatus TaxID=7654 RepID=UPI001BB2015E|nr:G-protein coupled receptor GRL101-like [Lytechinus variegatus]